MLEVRYTAQQNLRLKRSQKVFVSEESAGGSNIRATNISPGAIATELKETITDTDLKSGIDEFYKGAIEVESIARAIAFAIEEPAGVAVNEMIIRPVHQEW